MDAAYSGLASSSTQVPEHVFGAGTLRLRLVYLSESGLSAIAYTGVTSPWLANRPSTQAAPL